MIADYLNTYYNQDWVFETIKDYFKIEELVSPAVLSRYGEKASWSFFDPRLLANLIWIRRTRGNRIRINAGSSQQRGLRENTCRIVKSKTDRNQLYLSQHVLGSGVDFNETNGDSAEVIRNWIEENQAKLPYKCRLEWKKNGAPISWVHIDVGYFANHPKVYKFDV
jgi:hypothetical protein